VSSWAFVADSVSEVGMAGSGLLGAWVGLEWRLPWKKVGVLGEILLVEESPLVGREELLRWSVGSERRCRLKLPRRRRGLSERALIESERTDFESSPDELASSWSSSHAGVRGRVWLRFCWLSMFDMALMLSVDE
jgi:hypothetical protein